MDFLKVADLVIRHGHVEASVDVIGLGRDDFFEVFEALGLALSATEQGPQPGYGFDHQRIQPQGFFVVVLGLAVVSLDMKNDREIAMRLGVVGVEFQCLKQ